MNKNNLLDKTIKQYFISIINSIHINYPNIFTKELEEEWCKKLKINFKAYTENDKKKMKIKIFKYYLNKKYFNTGIRIKKHINVADENRCIARIWANGRIIKTKKNIIYGDRCSKKKMGDTSYCHLHIHNNIHEDFDKHPSNKIIYNFNKHSK